MRLPIIYTGKRAIANTPNAAAGLFAAYANDDAGDDPKAPQVDIVGTEPARYPAMAPAAERVITRFQGTDIRTVNYRGNEIVFYMEHPTTGLGLIIENKQIGYAELGWYIDGDLYNQFVHYNEYKVCGYDVYNDGRNLHLIAVLARSIDENGKPIPDGTEQDPNIIVCYVEFNDVGILPINPLSIKKFSFTPEFPR